MRDNGPDRRKHLRVPMKGVSAAVRCPRPSVGVDLSVGGIRFFTSLLGVKVGDTLHVELALQDSLVMVVGSVTRVNGFEGSAREITLAFAAVEPETEQLVAETVASGAPAREECDDRTEVIPIPPPEDVCELDHRRAYRAAMQIPVQYRTGLTNCHGTIEDVAIGGLAVDLASESEPPSIGSQLRLEFTLDKRPFDAGGEIVRHTEGGFGVRFVKLDKRDHVALRKILEALMGAEQAQQELAR